MVDLAAPAAAPFRNSCQGPCFTSFPPSVTPTALLSSFPPTAQGFSVLQGKWAPPPPPSPPSTAVNRHAAATVAGGGFPALPMVLGGASSSGGVSPAPSLSPMPSPSPSPSPNSVLTPTGHAGHAPFRSPTGQGAQHGGQTPSYSPTGQGAVSQGSRTPSHSPPGLPPPAPRLRRSSPGTAPGAQGQAASPNGCASQRAPQGTEAQRALPAAGGAVGMGLGLAAEGSGTAAAAAAAGAAGAAAAASASPGGSVGPAITPGSRKVRSGIPAPPSAASPPSQHLATSPPALRAPKSPPQERASPPPMPSPDHPSLALSPPSRAPAPPASPANPRNSAPPPQLPVLPIALALNRIESLNRRGTSSPLETSRTGSSSSSLAAASTFLPLAGGVRLSPGPSPGVALSTRASTRYCNTDGFEEVSFGGAAPSFTTMVAASTPTANGVGAAAAAPGVTAASTTTRNAKHASPQTHTGSTTSPNDHRDTPLRLMRSASTSSSGSSLPASAFTTPRGPRPSVPGQGPAPAAAVHFSPSQQRQQYGASRPSLVQSLSLQALTSPAKNQQVPPLQTRSTAPPVAAAAAATAAASTAPTAASATAATARITTPSSGGGTPASARGRSTGPSPAKASGAAAAASTTAAAGLRGTASRGRTRPGLGLEPGAGDAKARGNPSRGRARPGFEYGAGDAKALVRRGRESLRSPSPMLRAARQVRESEQELELERERERAKGRGEGKTWRPGALDVVPEMRRSRSVLVMWVWVRGGGPRWGLGWRVHG